MMTICARGVRGGVGSTSLLAMLARALHATGETVLVVDLNRSDMLRLHFDVPYSDPHGWAAARTKHSAWNEHAFVLGEGLWMVPYGRNGMQMHEADGIDASADAFWCASLKQIGPPFSVLLFDLPPEHQGYAGLRSQSDLDILVTAADAGCHVLLAQSELHDATRILVNQYDPSRQLSKDLLLDWKVRYRRYLLPVLMHRDESVHEAFAHKTTSLQRFPDSVASHDASAFAIWCLAQRGVDA